MAFNFLRSIICIFLFGCGLDSLRAATIFVFVRAQVTAEILKQNLPAAFNRNLRGVIAQVIVYVLQYHYFLSAYGLRGKNIMPTKMHANDCHEKAANSDAIDIVVTPIMSQLILPQ